MVFSGAACTCTQTARAVPDPSPKAMPELYKPWGYAMWHWARSSVSILIPLGIFKWRGWLSTD